MFKDGYLWHFESFLIQRSVLLFVYHRLLAGQYYGCLLIFYPDPSLGNPLFGPAKRQQQGISIDPFQLPVPFIHFITSSCLRSLALKLVLDMHRVDTKQISPSANQLLNDAFVSSLCRLTSLWNFNSLISNHFLIYCARVSVVVQTVWVRWRQSGFINKIKQKYNKW